MRFGLNHEDGKLVAAESCDNVGRAYVLLKKIRDMAQHHIAAFVAGSVIDGFEVVEVEVHERGALAVPLRGCRDAPNTGQRIDVGLAPGVRALRVNFVGELGWELHHPIEYQNHIFDALVDAGEEFGLGLCGMRAMDSLRIEKSYRMWGQDLTREYSVLEAGLERFVQLDKGDFTGRAALLKQQRDGVPQRFVTLEVEADDADPMGNEPLYLNGEMVGRATAGAYGLPDRCWPMV